MIHTFHRFRARKLLDPFPLLSVCWVKLKLEIQSGLYEFIDEDNKILYKCSSAKRVKETKELSKAAIGREGYEVILIAPSDSYINPSIKKLYSKIERM